ncbi:MAG: hypothetical protein AAGK21_14885 [Bacteroidota bacterium]
MRSVPDQGAISFRQFRDVGSALNATFALVRQNARELATSYLALVVPVLLASALSSALWLRSVGGQIANPAQIGSLDMFNWTYAGSIVFGLLGGALMQAASSAYVRLYREGEAGEITAGLLWEEARGLLMPYLGMTMLFGVTVTLSALLNIVPCLGAIAWLAFVIWLTPHYCVAVASRALEAESVSEAWRRSRELVKGSWGFAAGALLLAFAVLFILYFAVSIVLGGVLAVLGTSSTNPESTLAWMGFLMAPLQILSGAAYLIPLVAAFFVHGRLVEELEGTALDDEIDALASGLDAPEPPGPISTPPVADAPAPPASADDVGDPPAGGSAPSNGFRGGGFG